MVLTMAKKFIIGLDIGTSSIKGIMVAVDGSQRFTGRVPFIYTTRPDGSVEISAEDYLNACFMLLRQFSEQLPEGSEIAAVSTASASGNPLLLNENGTPITPIINWQDHRVTDEVKTVLGDFDFDAYYRSTGWAFDGKTFPLALLCWYKCHHPETLANCAKVCMSTEYLYYTLTGKWGIGTSAGTPFYLIDQVTGTYHTEILDKLGIPVEKLPPVMKTGSILGTVTSEGAEKCGLPAGTPIIIGTFDHPSAARGVGVTKEGQLLLSCGTSWVGFYPIARREKVVSAKMLVDPFLSEAGGPWAGMVSLCALGGPLEAFTKAYVDNGDKWYKALVDYAALSERGAGGLTVNLLAEPNEDEIKKYEKKHIARAIMENVIGMLANNINTMTKAGISCEEAFMVGGPSENPLWSELITLETGIKVRVMHGSYAGAVGAAVVAGCAVGLYADPDTARECLNEA